MISTPPPPPPPASVTTSNWAGYEWKGNDVAAAEFTIPNFPYSSMNSAEKENHSAMSIWTGLRAYPYIEQIGIYDYVSNGKVGWAGFCAFWPTSNVSCGHGISTGDKMAVSVHRSGLTYTMSMRDYGPHNTWSVSIKKTLTHADSTAVVIAEDSTYPQYSPVNLTHFDSFVATTSGDPVLEYESPWGYAVKTSSRSVTIAHK